MTQIQQNLRNRNLAILQGGMMPKPMEVLSTGELLLLAHDTMAKLKQLFEHRREFPNKERALVELSFDSLGAFARWVLAEEEAAHKAELARKGRKK